MRLADDKGELVELFRAPQLRSTVLTVLPDLAPQLDPDSGVHVIMATLERAVMDAIAVDAFARARAVGAMLDALLDRQDLDPEIPNAIAISFVQPEVLQASARGKQVWQDMPERVRRLVLANRNRAESPGE
jgi:phage tail protein X